MISERNRLTEIVCAVVNALFMLTPMETLVIVIMRGQEKVLFISSSYLSCYFIFFCNLEPFFLSFLLLLYLVFFCHLTFFCLFSTPRSLYSNPIYSSLVLDKDLSTSLPSLIPPTVALYFCCYCSVCLSVCH